MTSSFYYKKKRIKQGATAILESLARNEALLGEKSNFWNKECKKISFPDAQEFCQKQSGCEVPLGNKGFDSTSMKLQQFAPEYMGLENKLKTLL